jgi:manganese/iron transport system ATP-binding protein
MNILTRMRAGGQPGRANAHVENAPALELEGIDLRYDSAYALQDISFQIQKGQRVAVVGPNGAGKSTLFKVIAGVLESNTGVVKVFGHKPGGHICIAYVPQRSQVDWDFPVSVTDVVMMGRVGMLGYLHNPGPRDYQYVRSCLRVVGIEDLAERQIGELSGGQQQRMFIARALAQEAEIMLMDEPLTGLDMASQEAIFAIMDELRRREVTVMVATHDLNLAAERFDRIMLLNRRMLGFGTPEEALNTDTLMAAYGGHLRLMETEGGTVIVGDTCCQDEGVYDA